MHGAGLAHEGASESVCEGLRVCAWRVCLRRLGRPEGVGQSVTASISFSPLFPASHVTAVEGWGLDGRLELDDRGRQD